MATVKGMGPCPIPGENNLPCGRQIVEGEPVGTITKGSAYNPLPLVGHRRCADAYYQRVQAAERERNFAMVKRVNQSGAGGAVDFNQAYDAVQGSVPLEKKSEAPTGPPARANIIGDLSNGAHFIGDVPEDVTPDQAVQYAQGEPIKVLKESGVAAPQPNPLIESGSAEPRVQGFDRQELGSTSGSTSVTGLRDYRVGQSQGIQTAAQSYAKGLMGDPMPRVDALSARVVLSELHVRPDGTLHLDPEDAEDFIELLRVNVNRARRQQL